MSVDVQGVSGSSPLASTTESPEPQRFMFIGTQCDLWGRPDGTGKQEAGQEKILLACFLFHNAVA